MQVVNSGGMQSTKMVVNSSEDVAETIVNSSDDYSGISDFEKMVVNSSEDVAEAIVNSSDDYSGISDFEIIDDLDNGYHDDLDNDWENVEMKMKKVRVSDCKAGW